MSQRDDGLGAGVDHFISELTGWRLGRRSQWGQTKLGRGVGMPLTRFENRLSKMGWY